MSELVDDAEETIGRLVAVRLATAIGESSKAEVARRAQVSTKTLHRYLRGVGIKLSGLVALADACGVSVEWLATGRGSKHADYVTPRFTGTEQRGTLLTDGSEVASSQLPLVTDPPIGAATRQYVALPRYNIQASAGAGSLVEHAQVVEYLAFDIDFVRNRLRRDPKHLVLIEARGDSMEPTIRDGDILTVDVAPDQSVANSALYVLRVDDDLLVKRLERRLDGGVIVHSDNGRYASETLGRDQLGQLRIIGRVLLISTPPR